MQLELDYLFSLKVEAKQFISIAVIEDIEILREELIYSLGEQEDFQVRLDVDSIESYVDHIDKQTDFCPDILLLDIGLPGMSGIDGLPLIRKRQPSTDVIMLTSYEQQDVILKALCSGAVGYISKKASETEICDGVRLVAQGGSYMSPNIAREIVAHLIDGAKIKRPNLLSDRQKEIIDRLVDGATYGAIADELFISIETVRSHIKKMYRSLEVNNKAEAIAMYLRGEIG